MIITPSMRYEQVEVLLFDLFKGGRLNSKQIQIVLGIKSAIKHSRVISDAQAWRAREIVSEVLDDDEVIDNDDSEEARERATNYEDF